MNWWWFLFMALTAGVLGNVMARLRMRSPTWKRWVDRTYCAIMVIALGSLFLRGGAAAWVVAATVFVGLVVALIHWRNARQRGT